MPKIRKKFITENINERYYSIVNNINDTYSHVKINTGTPESVLKKSGVLTKSKKKIIREENSEIGTLPSTSITTGKILQDFNDPFNDTNTLEFKEFNNVNSNIGLPLIDIKDENDNQKGFYITKISEDVVE